MYLMMEASLRAAVLAAFPARGFVVVPLAKLLERMDILEREQVADLLIPAMSGDVRVVSCPEVMRGEEIRIDVDDIYALPPVPGQGYLEATTAMLQGDEGLRVEAVLMAFRAQLRGLAGQDQPR